MKELPDFKIPQVTPCNEYEYEYLRNAVIRILDHIGKPENTITVRSSDILNIITGRTNTIDFNKK